MLPQTILQGIKKSSENGYWDVKSYWISYASLWNSTTVTMLTWKEKKSLQLTKIFKLQTRVNQTLRRCEVKQTFAESAVANVSTTTLISRSRETGQVVKSKTFML